MRAGRYKVKRPLPTLEQCQLHPLWGTLTPQQQQFITVYLETKGNHRKAAHAAYSCSTDASALSMGWKTLRLGHVSSILGIPVLHRLGSNEARYQRLLDLVEERLLVDVCLSSAEFVKLSYLWMSLRRRESVVAHTLRVQAAKKVAVVEVDLAVEEERQSMRDKEEERFVENLADSPKDLDSVILQLEAKRKVRLKERRDEDAQVRFHTPDEHDEGHAQRQEAASVEGQAASEEAAREVEA